MGKTSRRRRTKRNKTKKNAVPPPPAPIKCTLCDDAVRADTCTQCNNDLCLACLRQTLHWCPRIAKDSLGPASILLCCPWCRLVTCVGDQADFAAGEGFKLKEILSTADTHAVTLTAKCCGNPTLELRHRACSGGCFACNESTVEIVSVTFPAEGAAFAALTATLLGEEPVSVE